MGRVFEALKRAAAEKNTVKPSPIAGNGEAGEASVAAAPHNGTHGINANPLPAREHHSATPPNHNGANGNGAASSAASLQMPFTHESPEHLLASTSSRTFAPASSAKDAAHRSASNEQRDSLVGAALHGESFSLPARATLDAASSARTPQFPSVEISDGRVEPHLISITQPHSAVCEQFRSLRTSVLQAGEQRKMQVFVITSVGTAEGKTIASLNLSWILAQTSDIRTLLIDGDLRRPCASDYLGIDADIARTGLSEVLAGEATLKDSIIRLEPSGLHLLPGGAARADVADLLAGSKFKEILTEARHMFDYIIIDAPPMGIFTDAKMLMNRADGALIVVRSGRVNYAALERILAPLPQERLLGIILNGTEEKLVENSYYYQKRYTHRMDGKVKEN